MPARQAYLRLLSYGLLSLRQSCCHRSSMQPLTNPVHAVMYFLLTNMFQFFLEYFSDTQGFSRGKLIVFEGRRDSVSVAKD